jgi:very-short-patch-repair endonuclease
MLQGIPDAQLFDGKQSLYDIAKRSFGGTICLLEHFRCVPEIIRFSNELSYSGRIKPLREPEPHALVPAVVEHRVASDPADNKKNEREARAVASLIVAATEQPEYDGKTFGVISMVGEEQAYRIEEIVRSLMPPALIDARRFLAGSAAQFQGDERNVMFLSVVDTGQGVPLPLRDTRPFQQRFNVAASRAQDQMWVVHSLDQGTELKPADLRRRLIDHARDPGASERIKAAALRNAESPFEEAVIRRLADAGYRVITQHSVGAYRIDIVVEGADRKRLAIECDGDRYHTIDNLRDDAERQAVLERLGWTFVRIRGSRFYRDADSAMKPVFDRLTSMGIEPHAERHGTVQFDGKELLLSRVRTRAAEIESEIGEMVATSSAASGRTWRRARRGESLVGTSG